MDRDRYAVWDGWGTCVDGVNSGEHPSLLPTGERAYLFRSVNGTCRGGTWTTRPGFEKIDLEFENEALREVFENGRFQGCKYYQYGSRNFHAVCVDGMVFIVDPIDRTVTRVTPSIGKEDPTINRVQFEQVNKFMVVQDNVNNPMIIEGTSAYRASSTDAHPIYMWDSPPEPKTGGIPAAYYMAFGQGRLFFARKGEDEFFAGDINLGGYPTAPLFDTEQIYLQYASGFKLPAHMGPITGMAFQQQLDTGSGVGMLIVSAKNGVAAYDVSIPRAQWFSEDIGRIVFRGHGATSPEGMLSAQAELYWMAQDGIRSIQQSRTEFQNLIETPLSREVRAELNLSTPWLLVDTQSMLWNNWAFWTIGQRRRQLPLNDGYETYHTGLVVMDFDFSSQLRGLQKPVYDGVWTGLKFMGLVSGVHDDQEMGFCYVRRQDRLQLYRINKDRFTDDGVPIPAKIRTPGFTFERPWNRKRLHHVDLFLEDIKPPLSIKMQSSADGSKDWNPVGETYEFAGQYALNTNPSAITPAPHVLPEFQSGFADDSMDDQTDRLNAVGYYHQLRLEIFGHCKIRTLRVKGVDEGAERTHGLPPYDKENPSLDLPELDDFNYDLDDGDTWKVGD